MTEIRNGRIEATHLGELGRGFSFSLTITGESWGQGFGGLALRDIRPIKMILHALEIDEWEHLKGTPVRVRRATPTGRIDAIGHFLKERWAEIDDMIRGDPAETSSSATVPRTK